MKEKQSQKPKVVTTKTANWKAVLQILAPQFIKPDTEMFISENDEIISFEIETARVEEFQNHFDNVLRSSESLDLQLSYSYNDKMKQSVGSSYTPKETFAIPSIQNLEQAKDFMIRLFGADTMQGKSKLPVNIASYFTKYENGVLSSEALDQWAFALASPVQAFLCAHLDGVNIHILRQIIAGKANHLQVSANVLAEMGKAVRGEGFVQTCFCIHENQMFIDIGKLLQFVYPPQIDIDAVATAESKKRITISASHLLLYVKQLSRHGILFSMELKYGKASARPVLLPHKETVAKPLKVYIVLDDSGSMRPYREKLFEHVRSLIQRIALVAPNALISLDIFSGHHQKRNCRGKAGEFNYNCFNGAAYSGETALYDAMLPSLMSIQGSLERDNNMLIVFTDGADTDSFISQDEILQKFQEIQKAVNKGSIPPEIHAIGYGKVNEDVLNKLAGIALRKEYTRLDHFDNLEHIIQKIQDFEYSRVMAEFKTTIEGLEETRTFPICLSGRPHVVAEVTIPLSENPVTVSFKSPTIGQELALGQVTLQLTRTQAHSCMIAYQDRVETIYMDGDVVLARKIAQLNEVLSEMNTFCSKVSQQIVLGLQTDLQKKIEEYNLILRQKQDTLNSSEGNPISSSSASNPSTSPVIGRLGRDSPVTSGSRSTLAQSTPEVPANLSPQ